MSDAIGSAAADRVVTRRAEHARASYDSIVLTCQSAVADTAPLAYLAHYTRGVFDFCVHPAEPDAAPVDGDRIDRTGRQLNLAVVRLDAVCAQLDSGPLIRVVVQGERAALFHYLKVVGQTVFGWARGETAAPIHDADHRIYEVVEAAVHKLGLQSINWGGFRARAADRPGEPESAVDPSAAAEPAPKPHFVNRIRERADEEVARCAAEALDVETLHYIGVFREGETVFSMDLLDGAGLAQYFQKTTAEGRRGGYAAVARQLRLQESRLERILASVDGGPLVRLILDVALGAIYATPLRDGGILLGVTLDQSQVAAADAAFGRLSARVQGRWPQT